jgi:hypothetical protein
VKSTSPSRSPSPGFFSHVPIDENEHEELGHAIREILTGISWTLSTLTSRTGDRVFFPGTFTRAFLCGSTSCPYPQEGVSYKHLQGNKTATDGGTYNMSIVAHSRCFLLRPCHSCTQALFELRTNTSPVAHSCTQLHPSGNMWSTAGMTCFAES